MQRDASHLSLPPPRIACRASLQDKRTACPLKVTYTGANPPIGRDDRGTTSRLYDAIDVQCKSTSTQSNRGYLSVDAECNRS